jgi:hypothetical protein
MHQSSAKKSLYIFLCSVLGVLLFVTLQHSLLFVYISLSVLGWVPGASLAQLVAYNTLGWLASLFLGGWYGVWLGLHWFDVVYVRGEHKGLVHHIHNRLTKRFERKTQVAGPQPKVHHPTPRATTLGIEEIRKRGLAAQTVNVPITLRRSSARKTKVVVSKAGATSAVRRPRVRVSA